MPRSQGHALVALLLSAACEGGECEEDIRAQVLDARAALTIGDASLTAEVARTDVERERGWKHRRCALEGLLLVAPDSGELDLWGCGMTTAIDVLWIRDGVVTAIDAGVEPCAEPCGGCPVLGRDSPVDAALEVPAGSLEVEIGAAVRGLAPWLGGA
ncbi:MAG: DUF192 domain-containing protein [Nannocystaceae bacterium]